MNMNDETGYDLCPHYTRNSHIKTEFNLKTGLKNMDEWENGIKNEVTEDTYQHTTSIEEIYIKSEPVDNSEYEGELESAVVINNENSDTQKTCIISSTDDMSQYNYNTNIIIGEEINIKSECGDGGKCEKSVTEQDTASAISCNPDESLAPMSVNEFKQINKTQCKKAFSQSTSPIDDKLINSGEKLFKCDQCNKTFSYSTSLNRHKRIHSGEKPFKCDECGKAFTQSTNLITHKIIHSGEKPYKCDQCNKAFSNPSNLNSHKITHSGRRPFKCDQCDKAFTTSSDLHRHKRSHSGEKPFTCDQCNKSFTQSTSLVEHKRIHSGERPFKCEQCDKTFSRKFGLIKHKRIHSGEKPFK